MATKICRQCGEEKLTVEFHADKSRGGTFLARCKPCVRARNAAYKKLNREQVAAASGRYYETNTVKILVRDAVYRKNNPEKCSALDAKKRAKELRALPVWFGEFDEFAAREAYHLSNLRRNATGVEWNVDHVVPFRGDMVCGLHCAQNLQVIPESENRRKGNSFRIA